MWQVQTIVSKRGRKFDWISSKHHHHKVLLHKQTLLAIYETLKRMLLKKITKGTVFICIYNTCMYTTWAASGPQNPLLDKSQNPAHYIRNLKTLHTTSEISKPCTLHHKSQNPAHYIIVHTTVLPKGKHLLLLNPASQQSTSPNPSRFVSKLSSLYTLPPICPHFTASEQSRASYLGFYNVTVASSIEL
jgi:hypothetical protein